MALLLALQCVNNHLISYKCKFSLSKSGAVRGAPLSIVNELHYFPPPGSQSELFG